MNIDRRKLFALGGLGAVGAAGTGALGPEYTLHGGITITIQQMNDGGWGVAVPDWDEMKSRWHKVHMTPVIKIMPMAEFFDELNKMDEPVA